MAIAVFDKSKPAPKIGKKLQAPAIANSDSPAVPRSEEEVEALGELKRASVGVGLGVSGLFFFPLQIAGVACLLPGILADFRGAYHSLVRERRLKSVVVNSVFIIAAAAGGLFVSLILGGWFFLLVKWLTLKTEDRSKHEIVDLFGNQFGSVWTVMDGLEVELPVEQVQAGNLIVIQAGEMIPMDGEIVDGHASLDQRLLTGESQPAEKGPGETVFATTMVLSGRIYIRVEKSGKETTAAQIGRALADTSNYKKTLMSRAEAVNDRMAGPVLLMGAVSLPFFGVSRALSLIMGMPNYRMTFYGPLSMLSFLNVAVRQGILIKDGRALERLHGIDTVIFDKTGTLTEEQPSVRAIHCCPGWKEEEVLTVAAAAETKQNHPIARAIAAEAAARGIEVPEVGDVDYELGYGITVQLNGSTVLVGSRRFMAMHDVSVPTVLEEKQTAAHAAGNSVVWVAANGNLAGAIVLHPTVRPEAGAVLDYLRRRGMKRYILSGDHDAPTRQLAEMLETDGYFAAVLPEGKAALVRELQAQGRKVCFIGDGINDSIALQGAAVSVSLHGASTIAIDRADIVLSSGDLTKFTRIFELSDEFAANMMVNYFAAAVPYALVIYGTIFLGWGLLFNTILYQISLPFALYNSARPLLSEPRSREQTRKKVRARA
jgi:Cu2+-exporting ATPase